MMIRIHDHFEGRAHCVECGGPCQLPEDERRVTMLVRWIFETGTLNLLMRGTLEELGVNVAHFEKRARKMVQSGARQMGGQP